MRYYMDLLKDNEEQTGHQWEELSTGEEVWDFNITHCQNCGKDWSSSDEPCKKSQAKKSSTKGRVRDVRSH